MRKILPLIAVLFAASAQAEEQITMPQFPSGWVEIFSRQGDQEIVEYAPPGQTAENWQKKISLEIYRKLNNLPLDTLQRRAASQARATCSGIREGKFQSGVNNGFASAFWTLGCERDKSTGIGETRYTKVVQGATGLYVLTQVWRTPAYGKEGPAIPPQEITAAVNFLTTSVVCDTTSPKSPCPK